MPPKQPENFPEMEKIETGQEAIPKPTSRYVRIEARPAKDIIEEQYTGMEEEPDYGDYDHTSYSKHFEDTAEPEEPLSYKPFQASTALRELRKFSPEEQALMPAERREIVRRRLADLKENLTQQNFGISSIIVNLRKTVDTSPDTTSAELFAMVKEIAPQYKLSKDQLDIFKKSLDDYGVKHAAVEKYRALYPKDEELFEACFGAKPTGEVRVAKGSMSLYFQCLSEDDYITAYSCAKTKEGVHQITEESKKRAMQSGGAALFDVCIDELKDAVAIENSRRNLRYEVVRQDKTAEIHNAEVTLVLDAQRKNVDIEVKGQGRWQVKIVERDNQPFSAQFPVRIQLLNLADGDRPPIFDVRRVMPDDGSYFGYLKLGDDPRKYGNQIEDLRVASEQGTQHLGYVNIDYNYLTVKDDSPEGTIVGYQEDVALPLRLEGSESSRVTRIHEEQHLFNRLFTPWNRMSFFRYQLMVQVAERAKSSEEAKEMIVHSLLRNRRQDLIDGKARDEIIAQYADGTNTENIFTTLTQSPLYNYSGQMKEEVQKLPSDIALDVASDMSEVIYQKGEDENGQFDYFVDAVPLTVDEKSVRRHFRPVFEGEYKRDMKVWLGAITLLERKGYKRETILGLLTQEPVWRWNALARRLGEVIVSVEG